MEITGYDLRTWLAANPAAVVLSLSYRELASKTSGSKSQQSSKRARIEPSVTTPMMIARRSPLEIQSLEAVMEWLCFARGQAEDPIGTYYHRSLNGARDYQLVELEGVKYLRRETQLTDVNSMIQAVVSDADGLNLDPVHYSSKSFRIFLATSGPQLGLSEADISDLGG